MTRLTMGGGGEEEEEEDTKKKENSGVSRLVILHQLLSSSTESHTSSTSLPPLSPQGPIPTRTIGSMHLRLVASTSSGPRPSRQLTFAIGTSAEPLHPILHSLAPGSHPEYRHGRDEDQTSKCSQSDKAPDSFTLDLVCLFRILIQTIYYHLKFEVLESASREGRIAHEDCRPLSPAELSRPRPTGAIAPPPADIHDELERIFSRFRTDKLAIGNPNPPQIDDSTLPARLSKRDGSDMESGIWIVDADLC
ncbi:hypothetical protein F5878DRAFT_661839 [Lentinula raphanica]|uniref:Uncharacterized protein n=1 Tax=Lentinula raphanica TaxID=153919 RepID=A0AA38P7H8_9AGAR|nr:hypothetical protein F5878DRAFT_661839 [Lentinula raphanica]